MEKWRSAAFVARARRGIGWRLAKARERTDWATRRATTRLRLRPTFLVIGAQKSGTTSLHGYLSEHPCVLCATVKEVQYFHRYYEQGESWYRAQFPLAIRGAAIRRRLGVGPAVGEASAAYLFDPRTPERVHEFNPDMKLVAVLRDPVERAYSHYQMEYRWERETLPFEEALRREETELEPELERVLADPWGYSDLVFRISYVARGRYAEQLERWLGFFPREQLLVLTSEELLAHPAEAMAEIVRFLGLPEFRAESYPLRGVREYPPMDPRTRERLARVFEPHNRQLGELLGRELGWTRPAGVKVTERGGLGIRPAS